MQSVSIAAKVSLKLLEQQQQLLCDTFIVISLLMCNHCSPDLISLHDDLTADHLPFSLLLYRVLQLLDATEITLPLLKHISYLFILNSS